MSFTETLIAFDTSLFLFLNTALANPLFDVVFRNATEATFWIVPGIGAAVLFVVKKRREALVVIGLMMVTVAITDPFGAKVLKPLFGRHRPCHPEFFIQGGHFLCGMKHSLSFPSNHAMNMFGQATLLAFIYPKWKWIYLSFACFIGYSRIYVGVHYPADVIAGAVFGGVCGVAVFVSWSGISSYVKRRWKGKARSREISL